MPEDTLTPSTTFVRPKLSPWVCYLFGAKSTGPCLTWRPLLGQHPNWFWRWSQYLLLGNLWVYDPEGANKW